MDTGVSLVPLQVPTSHTSSSSSPGSVVGRLVIVRTRPTSMATSTVLEGEKTISSDGSALGSDLVCSADLTDAAPPSLLSAVRVIVSVWTASTVAVSVIVRVWSASSVAVCAGSTVAVAVAVCAGSAVAVAVAVCAGSAVAVAVAVCAGSTVSVAVGVAVAVCAGSTVSVAVGVGTPSAVAVGSEIENRAPSSNRHLCTSPSLEITKNLRT